MSAPKAGKPADLSGDDDDAPSSVHEIKTIPPPGGAPDAYSAATVVKSVVPELLEKLATSEGGAVDPPTGKSSSSSAPPRTAEGVLANLGDASEGIDVHTGTVVMPETHKRRAELEAGENGAARSESPSRAADARASVRPAPSAGGSTLVAVALLALLAVAALVAATR